MVMPPGEQNSSSYTPKTTIPTTSNCEFQTYELVVCKEKTTITACMKESKERKGGKEKQTTLRNPKANASLNDQGVNIKVNM
jgi:hypothetical protein